MKKHLFILFIIYSSLLEAQDRPFTIFDTLNLKEIVVSQNVSLDENEMADKYRSSKLTSLDEINARLSGMSLVSRGAYALEPAIHGFSGGQVNITIDGMKMFGACTDKMDPITSYIEPENLGKLTINYGANGNLFGNTVGGSYDMALAQPKFSTTTPYWDMEFGGGLESVSAGKTVQAKVGFSGTRFAWKINGVYKDYEPYTDGEGKQVPFTQYSKLNLHNAFVVKLTSSSMLKLDILLDDAYDIGYPALPMDVSLAQGRIYALEYKESEIFGVFKDFKLKAYANAVYHLMDDSQRDSLFLIDNKHTNLTDSVYMKMDMPGWSNTYGAFMQGKLFLGSKHNISVKLESFLNKARAEMTMFMNNLSYPGEPPMYVETWPDNRRQVTGIYIEDKVSLGPGWQLGINSRLDYSQSQISSDFGQLQFSILGYDIDQAYGEITKSFNLNTAFDLGKKVKLLGGVGYGERLPTLSEQFGFYLFNAHDGYDYLGNPEIQKEKSFNSWFKIEYASTTLKLNADIYAYKIRDYVLGVVDTNLQALNLYAKGIKQYTNLDYAQVYAANLQAVWNPLQHIETVYLIKYNYGESGLGRPLPLIAPLKNILSVAYKKENYFVLAEAEASAQQNRIDLNYGEQATPGYTILNIRGGYSFKGSKIETRLSAGVENLFNKVYSEHLDWGNYYRPGRSFYVHLKFVL